MTRRRHPLSLLILAVLGTAGVGRLPLPGAAAAVSTDATRVSVDTAEGQIPAASQLPDVSDDGNVVAFESFADSGLPGDSTAGLKIYVRDVAAGTTNLVSITPRGNAAVASEPSVSDDGTKVVFNSSVNSLVTGDTNNTQDVFVRDLVAGTTQRVSLTDADGQASLGGGAGVISGDGTKVVFTSLSADLVPNDSNAKRDIFVRDLVTGTTTRINVGPGGVSANADSFKPSISDDGSVVAFESNATNLVSRDLNGRTDVFARVGTGPVTRLSRPAGTGQANNNSSDPFVRGDGQVVVFASHASNLVTGDTNGSSDIFSATVGTAGVTRVSLTNTGAQAGDDSTHPSISDDGLLIAFGSSAHDFGVPDSNGVQDVYVRDLASNTTALVSTRTVNVFGNATSSLPVVAGTGRVVAYDSDATNLVDGDTNGETDVFSTQATRCDGRLVTVDLNLGQAPTNGPDVVRGTPVANTLNLGAGIDRACMGAGSDNVTGGGDGDRIFGNAGNDTLLGTGGNDTLLGEAGADSFNGGAGTGDICNGGSGTDNPPAGCETVQAIP